MMKLSDMMKTALGAAELASHANTLTDIVGAIIGKEPPMTDGDKAEHIGWSGVFGHYDESEMVKLLAKLADTDSEGREIFIRFMEKKFPRGRSWPEHVAHMRSSNAFRSFVVNQGRTPSREYKVKETITKGKTGDVTEIEWGMIPGSDHALDFIKNCVEVIRSGATEAKGQNLLMKELRALNVPTQGDTLAKAVEKTASAVTSNTRSFDTWLNNHVNNLEQNRGPVRRFFDRFI